MKLVQQCPLVDCNAACRVNRVPPFVHPVICALIMLACPAPCARCKRTRRIQVRASCTHLWLLSVQRVQQMAGDSRRCPDGAADSQMQQLSACGEVRL